MRWQEYIENSLIGSGKVDKAAIFSATDGKLLAASSGFSPKAEEFQSLIKDLEGADSLDEKEFHIAGESYWVLGTNPQSIYGKKADGSVVIAKSERIIIVGCASKEVAFEEAARVIEKLVDRV